MMTTPGTACSEGKIVNTTRQTIIAKHIIVAASTAERMRGLLDRESINPQEALIITNCKSIHMFFMKFAIDVIFVDKAHKVVGLCPNIKPFELSPIFWQASQAIELPTGTIAQTSTHLNDQLTIN